VADQWGHEGARAHWQQWERGERELGRLRAVGWACAEEGGP
jgi:hypothetical protein